MSNSKEELVRAIMCWPPTPSFTAMDLPLPGDKGPRSVIMYAKQVERFRASYAALLAFTSEVVGREPDAVCPFDLVDPLLRLERARAAGFAEAIERAAQVAEGYGRSDTDPREVAAAIRALGPKETT